MSKFENSLNYLKSRKLIKKDDVNALIDLFCEDLMKPTTFDPSFQ
jgi:hypothetical protein